MSARFASVVFDADSTLAAIEGIDWLAALRGPALARDIAQLTSRAMAGELALEQVYAARLDAIRPTRDEIAMLGHAYMDAMEPGALELCARLRMAAVRVIVLSGGLRDALLPLATRLGIAADDVHAVDLRFDDHGRYVALADRQQLTQQTGKPETVRLLALPRPSAMIGDGSTDAAVAPETNAFFAYTRVARRPAVVAAATAEARDYAELESLLFTP